MSTFKPTHHPAGVLMNLIITLLTPMFLAAAEGNIAFARQAATETLNAYRAETGADLITVAKIIGFGLAALAAISLAMTDGLSLSTMLRLFASANASDRAEHRNRQVLVAAPARRETRHEQPWPTPSEPEPEIDIAALTARSLEMKALTAANLARFTNPAPQPVPARPETNGHDQAPAAAAQGTAASRPTLPPQDRRSAAIWAEVLTNHATAPMAGGIAPPPRQPQGHPNDAPGRGLDQAAQQAAAYVLDELNAPPSSSRFCPTM